MNKKTGKCKECGTGLESRKEIDNRICVECEEIKREEFLFDNQRYNESTKEMLDEEDYE